MTLSTWCKEKLTRRGKPRIMWEGGGGKDMPEEPNGKTSELEGN